MTALALQFRPIGRADVQAVVAMLADDKLGATRERFEEPLPECYWQAFDMLAEGGYGEIVVAVLDGQVVGCLEYHLHVGLARQGMRRAQIEAVRVASSHRGRGIGEELCRHAIERARRDGCGLIELTTDRSRVQAHRFYERLGFQTSHIGMKMLL